MLALFDGLIVTLTSKTIIFYSLFLLGIAIRTRGSRMAWVAFLNFYTKLPYCSIHVIKESKRLDKICALNTYLNAVCCGESIRIGDTNKSHWGESGGLPIKMLLACTGVSKYG